MITQTPRKHPVASASPSTSRYTPHKPAIPITPNRYRSPPSLSHASPSTSTSRRGSLAKSTDDSPPSKSSTSNWQASVELSLTTRRRLIRKPLPQIPSSQLNDDTRADNTESDLIDSSALDAQYYKAESWWPDALPEKQPITASSSSRSSTATQ